MAKPAPMKDFGIPVPSPAPAATDHLIVYGGPSPYTPSYANPPAPGNLRIDAGPVSGLTQKADAAGVNCYDDPISSELPAGLTGSYDFVFTLLDANGAEGDFSPPITAQVDTTVPPTLGQPVELG